MFLVDIIDIFVCPNFNSQLSTMKTLTYNYLNLESLRDQTGGNLTIEIEFMELFNDIVDEFIACLEKELPNKNWQKLYDATHKIKPNVTLFGIYNLESVIEELENNFRREENLEKIDDIVKSVIDAFKEIKKEIEWELNSLVNG